MNQIHTSYKVSKMLKEFLGESAPEPMVNSHYVSDGTIWKNLSTNLIKTKSVGPAYQLHDLLSKPFCEAMAKSLPDVIEQDPFGVGELINTGKQNPNDISKRLYYAYYFGEGMEAVEKTLMEMMEGR